MRESQSAKWYASIDALARDTLDDKRLVFKEIWWLLGAFLAFMENYCSLSSSGKTSQWSSEPLIGERSTEIDLKQHQASRANIKLFTYGSENDRNLKWFLVPIGITRNHHAGVWGDDQPDSNSLKVHIFNLRKQSGCWTSQQTALHTIAGKGLRLGVTRRMKIRPSLRIYVCWRFWLRSVTTILVLYQHWV